MRWHVYRRHNFSNTLSAELIGRYKYKWLAFLMAHKHSNRFSTMMIKPHEDEY